MTKHSHREALARLEAKQKKARATIARLEKKVAGYEQQAKQHKVVTRARAQVTRAWRFVAQRVTQRRQ